MSQSLLTMMGQDHADDFQTPRWAVDELMQFIETDSGTETYKETPIWEPACGRGHIVSALINRGYDAFGSDIANGYNFLDTPSPKPFGMIITNPPFSLKNKFLKTCYDYGVPFALLLPLNSIGSVGRKKMYKAHGIQIVLLSKRVDFEYPDGSNKEAPWFETAWFCNGFGFEKDINFV